MNQRQVSIIIILVAAIALGAVIYSFTFTGVSDTNSLKDDLAFSLIDENGKYDKVPDMLFPGEEYPIRMAILNGYPDSRALTAEICLVNYTIDPVNYRMIINDGKVVWQEPVEVYPYETKYVNTTLRLDQNMSSWNMMRVVIYHGSAPDPSVSAWDRMNQSYRFLQIPIGTMDEKEGYYPSNISTSIIDPSGIGEHIFP